MGASTIPYPPNYPQEHAEIVKPQTSPDWLGIAAGGGFLAGALLLLSGKKRAGLVVAATATALTLLDQEETVREWWEALPHYLDHAQQIVGQVQGTVDNLVSKRDKFRSMFGR